MPGNGSNDLLVAPERNNFFYGKLMDVPQFEKDYAFNLQKRLLVNRLVIGSGVIVGLDVIPDLQSASNVIVRRGAAIDSLGREIVVPEDLSIDPHQLTDDQGNPSGDPVTSGNVLVAVLYAESKIDMVPKLVADCPGNGKCDCNTVREGYRIIVRNADPNPPAAPSCNLAGGFPLPVGATLQDLLSQRIRTATVSVPTDTVIALARISISNLQGITINSTLDRPLVYGNQLLYELILCLSDRVSALAQAPILRYVTGDGQTAKADNDLDPIMVQLVDSAGNGLPNQTVQFQVAPGGGTVGGATTLTATTDPNGNAQTTWHLGTNKGKQTVIATAVGSVLTVTFSATAK